MLFHPICLTGFIVLFLLQKWLNSSISDQADRVAKELDDFFDRVIQDHVHPDEHKADLLDLLLSIHIEDSMGFPFEMKSVRALILVSKPSVIEFKVQS